jgi:hypothetical protein
VTAVFLGCPAYGGVDPRAMPGLNRASREVPVTARIVAGSLLANVCNKLYCEALTTRAEHGYTHFALHHADVASPPGWLDTLLGEMDAAGADAISAVVPIKDRRGLTSTGLLDRRTDQLRRLTMREATRLPVTFDAAAAGGTADELLAVNTGLVCWRIDRPWATKVWFEIRDRIREVKPGVFRAAVLPEDWHLSKQFDRLGVKVVATRAVKLGHWGSAEFRNDSSWGEWDTDHGDPAEG